MNFTILFLTLSLFTLPLSGNYSETVSVPWGVDSDMATMSRASVQVEKPKRSAGKVVCASMIHFFQEYISPIDGVRSSYYPSSSQYTLEAIERYGVFKGITLGCDRLLRENGEAWVYEKVKPGSFEFKHDPVR